MASDSIGFRCFDPVIHELATERGLLFNEAEVSKRHEILHKYDNRRDLMVSGGNDQIPLISRADHTSDNLSRKVYAAEPHQSFLDEHTYGDASSDGPSTSRGGTSNPTSSNVLAPISTVISTTGVGGSPTSPSPSLTASKDTSVSKSKLKTGRTVTFDSRISAPEPTPACSLPNTILKTANESMPRRVVSFGSSPMPLPTYLMMRRMEQSLDLVSNIQLPVHYFLTLFHSMA